MPRQFGQSPLAFALQQALQQGGGLVSSIPALKMQNQEFANQQQDFEQGQLAQMVRLALAQREDQRRQSDFEQGIRDREAANDRTIMDREAAEVQSRNVGRLADKFGLPGDLFAGAGGTTAQLDDIIRALTPPASSRGPSRFDLLKESRYRQTQKSVPIRAELGRATADRNRTAGLLADPAKSALMDSDSLGVSLGNLSGQVDSLQNLLNRTLSDSAVTVGAQNLLGGAPQTTQQQPAIGVESEVQQLRAKGVKQLSPELIQLYRDNGWSDDEINAIMRGL